MQVTIGNILIFMGVCFAFIGLVGIYRFDNFYAKLAASSKIDTVAMITLILGVSMRSGISWFTLKALLLMAFVLFINPIITSKIVLSAREDEQNQQKEKVGRKEEHGSR